MTYKSLRKIKKHIVLKNEYERIFSTKIYPKRIRRNTMVTIKYPIFGRKVVLFGHHAFVSSTHKRNINATLCLSSYISKNRFTLTIPFHYPAVNFN